MKKFWLAGVFLVLILFVTACSVGPNRGTLYQEKYYKGYESLDIEFGDSAPPYIFYYDTVSWDNEMPIIVTVRNKGASAAQGAIFIHGFDPHFVQIAGGGTPTGTWSGDQFTVGGWYSGISGIGGVSGGWAFPTGTGTTGVYGSGVFTPNGLANWVINIDINGGGIGYGGLADFTMNLFASNTGWNSIIALPGDTEYNPGGGLEVYEFPAFIYGLPPSLEEFRQPIMVTACYSYATRATAMMCIDPYPNSNTKKACYPRSVSMSGGQGAPVSITSVEQQSSNRKTVFTINVQHNRQNSLDDVFYYESLWKCNPESGALVKPTDKNIIYIGRIGLSGYNNINNPNMISCSPDYKVRLDAGGRGQITCTAFLDSLAQSAYQAPLSIELWYGYSKNIYKEVIIKKL
jgi:hypothetical protein